MTPLEEKKERRAKNILQVINRLIKLLKQIGIVAEVVIEGKKATEKTPGRKRTKNPA